MKKQYIVRRTEEEQSKLEEVVKKLKVTSQSEYMEECYPLEGEGA